MQADTCENRLPSSSTYTVSDCTSPNREEKGAGTLHMASVGRITEHGGPCRWIEVELDAKTSGGKNEVLLPKVLVPESTRVASQ
jgi:hypothetical protein